MSFESEMVEAEQDICDRFNRGEIELHEFNKEIQELGREYRAQCDQACQEAYDREAENW